MIPIPEGFIIVEHENLRHVLPVDDTEPHEAVDCTCGTSEVIVGGELYGYIHSAFDKRHYPAAIALTKSYAEGRALRQEQFFSLQAAFRQGKISTRRFKDLMFETDGTIQDIFHTN